MILFSAIKCAARTISRSKKNLKIKKDKPTIKPDVAPIFRYAVSDPDKNRVYVWGLAEHGALGSFHRVSRYEGIAFISKPSRSLFGEQHKIYDIATGYGFTVFAVKNDNDGILYGCGLNTDSQIGRSIKDKKYPHDIILSPRPIPLPVKNKEEKVIDLSAGRAHLLVLTNEGLYTLGNNGYGQCGRPIINNEDYKQSIIHFIPDIKGKKITAVTAGQDHSMVLTEKGEVYSFGWGADGQTGLAHYHNEYNPSLIKGDLAGEKVKKIACSSDCVLALTERGKVYGWGNSEYSQLTVNSDSYQINVATELKFCEEAGHIVDIASGGTFCMILNNEGKVYVWGYGILGLGPEVQKVIKPTLVPPTLFGKNEFQPDLQVKNIFCGLSYMAALTNNGDLYMWGRNKWGSLGLGHLKDQFFPFKVSVSAHVNKIRCGVDHTIALCKPFL